MIVKISVVGRINANGRRYTQKVAVKEKLARSSDRERKKERKKSIGKFEPKLKTNHHVKSDSLFQLK